VRIALNLLLIILLLPTCFQAQMTMVFDNDLLAYNRGLELYEKQKYGAAKDQFELAVQTVGNQNSEISANAHFYVAECALELFHKDAEFLLKEFIRNYSSSPRVDDAWFLLGNYNYRKKKWEEAIEYYDELQVLNMSEPRKSEYLFKKAYTYFQLNSLDEAAGLFYQMDHHSSPYFAPGTYYLGHINYEQGQYAAALKSFISLEGHAQFGEVIPYYIVQIYHFQKDYDKAIEYGTPFLSNNDVKRKAEISRVVADAYYHKEKYKEAIPFLEDFMSGRTSKEKEDYYALGYSYYRVGEYNKAAEQFSKISYAEDKIGQSALYHMGEAYLKAGKKSYARNSYRSASKMDFDPTINEDALFKYAQLSYELAYDPYDGAIAAFKEYTTSYPNKDRTQEAYDYLVNIYLTSKNYDAALASIEEYTNPDIRLKEAYQRIAYNKGLSLFKERSYKPAIGYLEKSLKYEQSKVIASLAQYWISECNYYMGSYTIAAKDYEKFIYSPAAALTDYFNLANYNVGYAYFQQDKFLEAPNWFRRYTSVRSEKDSVKLSDANLRIGDCYFMLNNYDGAQIYYSEAVKLGKSDPDYALYQSAMTSGLLKRPNDKLIGLETLVNKYPKSRYLDAAYYEIGRTQIMMGQDNEALATFNKVVKEFPGSSYVRKALVSLGQTHYNAGRDDEALATFQRIVKDYPTYEDSREALIGIESIYVARGQVAAFEEFVNGLDFVNFSETARDSLNYGGAETQYFNGQCTEAVDAFTKYLNRFPKAIFSMNSRFYRAECLMKMGKFGEAIVDYEFVAAQPKNKFTESALVQVARQKYKEKNYTAALASYKRLSLLGEYKENLFESEIGQMRTNFELKNYTGAVANAIIALESDKADQKLITEANLIIAKSNIMLDSPSEASEYFEKVIKDGSASQAAEAMYLKSRILFNEDHLDSAESVVFAVIENYRSEAFWVAKSLILLSDIYVTRGDLFQAKATLQSVLDNYKKEDEVKTQAKSKLTNILDLENRKPEETNEEIEIYFNATDSINTNIQQVDSLRK
jgi:TolA-binding protein